MRRAERPSKAFSKAAKVQPGRLAHGPDEKLGFCGYSVGFVIPSTNIRDLYYLLLCYRCGIACSTDFATAYDTPTLLSHEFLF